MTIGTAQIDAIARSLTAHGTGPKNVARLAKLFNVTESSLDGAVTLANVAAHVPTVTETAPIGDRRLYEAAQQLLTKVNRAKSDLPGASTGDLYALTAALIPR